MSKRVGRSQERHPDRPAFRSGLVPFGDTLQARVQWRDRLLACVFSVSLNLIVFAALFWPYAAPSHVSPPPLPIRVTFVDLSEPKPDGPPDLTVRPPALHLVAPTPLVMAVASTPAPDKSELLSESQLAGAASAGEDGVAGGGRACDTAAAVQQALRRDPLVRTAVEEANRLGKATMLWNGDWVRSGGQDGKGLSAAREAVMWEVAFAPEACRNQRMHGLVLLSLADGGTRFAIGADDWRWSDLLGLRGVAPDR